MGRQSGCPGFGISSPVRGFLLATLVLAFGVQTARADRPRLVLQITVDALRADLPGRVLDRVPEGGLRYLYEHGTVYDDARYRHANTETIVGHTVLATGAQPEVNGMIANVWLDRKTGNLTYNIEDDRYPLLDPSAGVDRKTEIDPTQKLAQSGGRSPAAILVPTFGDQLLLATDGRAKVFGVSVKDRGAVALAGHGGKAFWFSKKTGRFVTSTYYYDAYPEWVRQWNDEGRADRYAGTSWTLSAKRATYRALADDRPYETALPGYGRVFPHPYGPADGKYFTTLLTLGPPGDELTASFAKALLSAEHLGADDVPDYLSVSFSSTDYVSHAFGPGSLEAEDNLLRLDRTLADLLAFVDEKVGLDHTLVVLSADHGGPEAPEYAAAHGLTTGRLSPKTIDTEALDRALRAKLGVGKEVIETYYHPYVYLNRAVLAKAAIDPARAARVVAETLSKIPGIAAAVASVDLAGGTVPETPQIEKIRRNFHPDRSGDIYLVPEPYWFLYPDESIPLAAIHGSPWRYDTWVPIVFAGAGIGSRHVVRNVEPAAIAPTLAAVLGIPAPAGSEAGPLAEIVEP